VAQHVCPWWGGWFIDNPLRRLLHNPEQILGPFVKPGMAVMDVGCGMGFCSIAMAKMVGDEGKVVAVDLQQKMLDVLVKRAEKAGVAGRIETHRCETDNLGVDTMVDFALAFMMVHEVPDTKRLLEQVYRCLKSGGKFFVAEPRIHVPAAQFEAMVKTADEIGLKVSEEPHVRWCRAVVLAKQ
jgi:ubiquinone/menaquinone biosynthesis C-methylase UbiE